MSGLTVRASTGADVARCAEIYGHHVLHGTASFEVERDPLVRSQRVRVDGVDEVQTDYWVNSVTSGAASSSGASIPPNVAAALSRFVNESIG